MHRIATAGSGTEVAPPPLFWTVEWKHPHTAIMKQEEKVIYT